MSSGTERTQRRVEPTRTCVGCRSRQPASILLRVVVVAGSLIPDPRRTLPGRGAWLHPDQGCLDAAERRRAFGRALRLTRTPDSSGVAQYLGSGIVASAVQAGDGNRDRSALRGEARDVRKQVDPS